MHAGCGIWGLLAVGAFAAPHMVSDVFGYVPGTEDVSPPACLATCQRQCLPLPFALLLVSVLCQPAAFCSPSQCSHPAACLQP